jgi:type I restriction enzyme S subunit
MTSDAGYPSYRETGRIEAPSVPGHWTTKRLQFVCSCNDDALPESTDPDFEFNYVDIGNVFLEDGIRQTERLTFAKAPSRARRRVREGDSIISTVRTYLKAVARIGADADDMIVSTGFAVLHPTGIDDRFLGYAIQTPHFVGSVVARSKGVSYPAINASELIRIEIPVPPLDEQRAIVQFLDRKIKTIDQLVSAKDRLLELLDEKRHAVITNAITTGLNRDCPMKDSGEAWLGPIPKHWSILQAKFVLGPGTYGISESLGRDGEIGVLRMGDIGYGTVNTSGLACVEAVDEDLLLENGDLLFNRTNSFDQVAKVGLFANDRSDAKVSFASYLVRFRPSGNVRYLNYLLNIPAFLGFARAHALRAIGQVNLNPVRYAQLKICVPPLDEQEAIVNHLDHELKAIGNTKQEIASAIVRLKEYRSSLITDCVMGKLDVRPSELREAAE